MNARFGWGKGLGQGVLYQHFADTEYLPELGITLPKPDDNLDYFSLHVDWDWVYDNAFDSIPAYITARSATGTGAGCKSEQKRPERKERRREWKHAPQKKGFKSVHRSPPPPLKPLPPLPPPIPRIDDSEYYTKFCCDTVEVSKMLHGACVPVYNMTRTDWGMIGSVDVHGKKCKVKMTFSNLPEFSNEFASVISTHCLLLATN